MKIRKETSQIMKIIKKKVLKRSLAREVITNRSRGRRNENKQ